MSKRGAVEEEAWRAMDRRRALLVGALGGLAAAGLTVLLYFL